MIGKTNVGGGTQFTAALEITTDEYAEITAVNPAGDTVSGVADENGELTLTFTNPGTYTVTETDGGEEIIAIADNEATYQLEIFAFNGTFISEGAMVVRFTAYNQSGSDLPTVASTTISGESAVYVQQPSGNSTAVWLTEKAVDISEYSSLIFRGAKGTAAATRIQAIDDQGNTYPFGLLNTQLQTYTYSLNLMDKTKNWKFGVILVPGNSLYFVDLMLQ